MFRCRKLKSLPVIASALAIAVLFVAAPPAKAADKITLGMAIPLSVVDGGDFALADELGFFREENIDLEIKIFQGAGVVIPQVATRAVTVGHPLPDPLLSSFAQGNPVPIQYFYNSIPRNVIEIAVRADSPIQTIADLKGKKIGVVAVTIGTIPQVRALLRDVGLEAGKDVDLVAVGPLNAGALALRDGRVDALNYNFYWHDLIDLSGVKLRRLPFTPVFKQMVSNGFMAHQALLKENPDLLARFGRAIAKSRVACTHKPQACVEAYWRRSPEAKPTPDNHDKALADAIYLVKRWQDVMALDDQGKPLVTGAFDQKVISEYVAAMKKLGEFGTSDVPVDHLFTNALVAEFSKFDANAVRAKVDAAR